MLWSHRLCVCESVCACVCLCACECVCVVASMGGLEQRGEIGKRGAGREPQNVCVSNADNRRILLILNFLKSEFFSTKVLSR